MATLSAVACPCFTPNLQFITSQSHEDFDSSGPIFRDYADQLGVALYFQDFDAELANLPGEYSAPRGALLLATIDGKIGGGYAMRAQDSADYAEACEIERRYVRKAFRRFGLSVSSPKSCSTLHGRPAVTSCFLARVTTLKPPWHFTVDLGFLAMLPHYYNPIPAAHYLKADI